MNIINSYKVQTSSQIIDVIESYFTRNNVLFYVLSDFCATETVAYPCKQREIKTLSFIQSDRAFYAGGY